MKEYYRAAMTMKAFEVDGEQVTATFYTGEHDSAEGARDAAEVILRMGHIVAYRVIVYHEDRPRGFFHQYVKYQPPEYDALRRLTS